MTIPRVSVIIPAHNAAEYLDDALKSVIGQSYHDFELIVVNDGSTDRTADILFSYQSDPRVRVLHLGANAGEAHATNLGIQLARGEFIARLDADDVAMPNRLEQQVELMDRNPSLTLAGGQIMFLQGGTNLDFTNVIPQSDAFQHDENIKVALLAGGGHILTNTAMWRRNWFVERNIWWREELPSARDHRFWTDAMLCGAEFANQADVLALYRVHHSNSSRDTRAVRLGARLNRIEIIRAFYPTLTDSEIKIVAPLFEPQLLGWDDRLLADDIQDGIRILERLRCLKVETIPLNNALLENFLEQWLSMAKDQVKELQSYVKPCDRHN